MVDSGREQLFNTIAPVYGWFFNLQRRHFSRSLALATPRLDLAQGQSVLDVGCGTGALCSVLEERGLVVTGIEPAAGMLAIAQKKLSGRGISLIQANVLDRLPFADQSFDVTIASFVAHGLMPAERQNMYREMSRLSRDKVILYDYNQKRSPLTTLLEWLERGDYFRFIQQAESEMVHGLAGSGPCFSSVEVIPAQGQASFYICTPLR